MPNEEVAEFYDNFNQRLLTDYFLPNARVEAQYDFLRAAIAEGTRSILIVGCGTGEVASMLAQRFKQARLAALDISRNNIATARRLFAHPRVQFEERDILCGAPSRDWEVLVFPDSYEHIRSTDRAKLHAVVAAALAPAGRVLLACPTIMKQRSLRATGGLQVVDEDVTLTDVQRLAADIGGEVSHFSLVQVWGSYDYFHAVVARDIGELQSLTSESTIELHRGRSAWQRAVAGVGGRLHVLSHPIRTWHALRLAMHRSGDEKARPRGKP